MTIILTVTLFVKSISVIYMEDLKNPVYRTRESTDVSFHCCCLSAPWLSALSEMKVKASRTVFAIPWTAVCSAPLFMEYSRQEYWSGLPFPSLGDLPDWGIKPRSPTLQADSSPAEPAGNLLFATQCSGILQARILEWVVFPFSRVSSQPGDQSQVFCSANRFFASMDTCVNTCVNTYTHTLINYTQIQNKKFF